jgi:hypothetical protein
MKELLELKQKFGLDEPRLKDGGKNFTCSTDFISRVGGDVATKGRMVTDAGGTAPSPHTCKCHAEPPSSGSSAIEQAISALAPDAANLSADDIETLVQTITDQVMASV